MHRTLKIILLLLYAAIASAQVKFLSYNVENLFDIYPDSTRTYNEYLPEGSRGWTYSKYQRKLQNLAKVITNAAGWQPFDLVGIMEVENARCLRDLCYNLKNNYAFIHYESPDFRGIDVAMLYNKKRVKIITSEPIKVSLPSGTTRDLLYSQIEILQDTFHIIVCHLPSQLGGISQTKEKRKIAKGTIQNKINDILNINKNAKIVVFGDMNCDPEDDLQNLQNMMVYNTKGGTYKYQNEWSTIDQVYITENLKDKTDYDIYKPDWILEEDTKYMGHKPLRTFSGFEYKGGYSDHLPVIIRINSMKASD